MLHTWMQVPTIPAWNCGQLPLVRAWPPKSKTRMDSELQELYEKPHAEVRVYKCPRINAAMTTRRQVLPKPQACQVVLLHCCHTPKWGSNPPLRLHPIRWWCWSWEGVRYRNGKLSVHIACFSTGPINACNVLIPLNALKFQPQRCHWEQSNNCIKQLAEPWNISWLCRTRVPSEL